MPLSFSRPLRRDLSEINAMPEEGEGHPPVLDEQAEHLEGAVGEGLLGDEGIPGRTAREGRDALTTTARGLHPLHHLLPPAGETIGRSEPVDAHVGAAVVVMEEEPPGGFHRFGNGLEVDQVPELPADGADQALDLPPTLGPIARGDMVIDELVLEEDAQGGGLAPGEEAVYRIAARGVRAGNSLVRVQVSSDALATPVSKEEHTKVYSDR